VPSPVQEQELPKKIVADPGGPGCDGCFMICTAVEHCYGYNLPPLWKDVVESRGGDGPLLKVNVRPPGSLILRLESFRENYAESKRTAPVTYLKWHLFSI